VGIFGRRRDHDDDVVEGEYASQDYYDDEDVDEGVDGTAADAGFDEDGADGGYDGEYEEYLGPYDVTEAPEDNLARLDLGSVRVPMPAESQIQVEVDPAGPLRAVHVVTSNARFTISGYAAPRSGGLWDEISRELADQLNSDGARVRKEQGEWGVELVAFVNEVLLRFVGVDGPRWMLRAVAAGPKEQSAKAAEELRNMVRETVVVRGDQPMPVRTPLPLTLPQEIAAHIQSAQPQ
jgi:hypothetical protein